MPNDAKVAERLLAHAQLCRRIARRSWSEETATKVTQFADECARAASECEHQAGDIAQNRRKRPIKAAKPGSNCLISFNF